MGHFAMKCGQFADARVAAHNEVATATITEVHNQLVQQNKKEAKKGERKGLQPDPPVLWLDTPMERVYSELWDSHEGSFRPDGLIVHAHAKTVLVLELTRGMDGDEQVWRDKEDTKIAAYHATRLFLQARYPGWRVEQLTFVIGVLGSVVEDRWHDALSWADIEEKGIDRVIREALRAAVRADLTLTARTIARDALGGEEAGFSPHPSQRGRPPA